MSSRFSSLGAALVLLLFGCELCGAEIAIWGRLLDVNGDVLSESRVLLIPVLNPFEQARRELAGQAAPEPVAGTLTDPEGYFRLVAPEAGMWTVIAQAPGFVPMQFQLLPLIEEYALPTVHLPRDAGLSVRVVGRDGQAIAGARVQIDPPRYSGPKWQPAPRLGFTEGGKTTLPRSADENPFVRVFAPGYLAETVVAGRRRQLAVELAEGVPRLIAVRDPRRQPAAGVIVRIGGQGWAVGETGQDGRLFLHASAQERLDLELLSPEGDYAATHLAPLTREKAEEKDPVVIRLSAPTTLRGRVLDARWRTPVTGSIVWLWGDHGSFRRTGAAGGFELRGRTGTERWLYAVAAGYFDEFVVPGVLRGSSREVTLILLPKVAIDGVVVDERGKPVSNVAIRARPQLSFRTLPQLARSGGLFRSSAGGSFRIGNLLPETAYDLRFSKEGFAPLDVPIPARPDEQAADLRIVMRPGRTATGLVLDADEAPVADAAVNLRLRPNGDDGIGIQRLLESPEFAASTAAGGRYEIPDLAPGRYDLTVEAYGFAPLSVPGIVVGEGLGPMDLGTVLLAPGATVEGRVLSPDGEPLEGVEVFIVPADRDAQGALMVGRDMPAIAALSDANGRFLLSDRTEGEKVKLMFRRSGYSPRTASGVEAPTTKPLEVVLHPTSRVSGRTLDAQGRPVPAALVRLDQPVAVGRSSYFGINEKHTFSDDGGLFLFAKVESGPAQLNASAPGYQPSVRQQLEVREGRNLEEIQVVLLPGVTVAGRVLTPSGDGAAGARISWFASQPSRSPGSFQPGPPVGPEMTDGDGRYELEGLPPGRLSVAAVHDAYGRVVRDLDVVLGDNPLDLQFAGGWEVNGRVSG